MCLEGFLDRECEETVFHIQAVERVWEGGREGGREEGVWEGGKDGGKVGGREIVSVGRAFRITPEDTTTMP